MRPVLVVVLLMVGMPLSILAPVADAVGICVQGIPGHGCDAHLACLGRTVSDGREACLYAVGGALP